MPQLFNGTGVFCHSGDGEKSVHMRETDSVAAYFMQAMIHGLADNPQRLTAALEQANIAPALLDQPTARCRPVLSPRSG